MSSFDAQLFFRFFDSPLQSLNYDAAESAKEIMCRICSRLGLVSLAPFAVSAGPFHAILIHGLLVGGKGGFGSMLRAQGGRMSKKKITNFDSCRDLSGQRLRTVRQAKEAAELMAKAGEIKRKREEEIERKIQSALEAQPKKKFYTDTAYIQQSRELVDQVEAAVQGAFASDASKDGSSSESDTRSHIDPLLAEFLSEEESEKERATEKKKNKASTSMPL